MKKTRNLFMTIVMAFVMLFAAFAPFVSVNKKQASALSPDYLEGISTVYYFSDSDPSFKDSLDSYVGVDIVYDTCPLLTAQELAHMVYTGYFWGFNESLDNIVIIEIKTMKPDPYVLENLFACLKAQGCKVMFISPYIVDFSDSEYADVFMACNVDKYSRYIKNCVRSMLSETGVLRDDTTLLLDGRFIGIDSATNYNSLDLYFSAPTLRRLLFHMYYGCDTEKEKDYEESLYRTLWERYKTDVVEQSGLDPLDFNLNYFDDDTQIYGYMDYYIAMWRAVEEANTQMTSYNENCKAEMRVHCQEMIDVLDNKDVYLIAHADGTVYIDILNNDSNNTNINAMYTYIDYTKMLHLMDNRYFYSMGIWYFKSEFYNVLLDIPKNLPNEPCYSNVVRYPYIWVEDPFVETEGGLEVILEDTLELIYGDGYQEYDEDVLAELFISAFISLF